MRIFSISSNDTSSLVRSYSFVVRGDSSAAICCAFSTMAVFVPRDGARYSRRPLPERRHGDAMTRRLPLALLAAAIVWVLSAPAGAVEPVPDRLVVLTF